MTDSAEIATGPAAAGRPRLLLHVCCGPCATHCIEVLRPDYEVVLFFANANIYPAAEYRKRREEVRRLAAITNCALIEDEVAHKEWLAAVRGLEAEPERGRRCRACFAFNLARTAAYARNHDFPQFTTTLSVSPHKDADAIAEIGLRLGPFLRRDFKKKDGFRHSVERSRRYGLYRQHYCGCEFSLGPAAGADAGGRCRQAPDGGGTGPG